MNTQYCPVCAEEVVNPLGSSDCDYIILEEFPELVIPPPAISSRYQKDEWTPRKILMNELAKVGMVLAQFRVVSVYPHHSPDSGIANETCYDDGLARAVNECMGKKGVIVLGGNLCKYFTGYELKQVQGLSGVPFTTVIISGLGTKDLLNVPRVFLPTIRSIYSTNSGEFGIGLSRFANQIGVE